MSMYPELDPPKTPPDDDRVPRGIPLLPEQMEQDPNVPLGTDPYMLPEPGLRNEVGKEISHSVEAHTIVSALLLVTAVSCDCLATLDVPIGDSDAPSSLRISSLVLVATAASPAIKGKKRRINIVDQRVVLSLLMALLAFLGKHHASETTRTGDCVYTVFVLLMTVQIYNAGGIESGSVRPDDILNAPHRRQTVSGLCFALMLYCGLRGLRTAVYSSEEALNFRVVYTVAEQEYRALGYAQASTSSSVPLGFGHGVLICTALAIGLHTEAFVTGSSAVAFEVGSAGVAASIAALWGLLGYADNLDSLPSLYGQSACSGSKDLCFEAYRARRFAITNGSTSSLWIASLSAMVFSFAVERRIYNVNPSRSESLWERQGIGVGLFLLAAALAGIWGSSSSEGSMWYTDAVAMASVVAVFLSAFVDTLLGSAIYIVAMGYEEFRLWEIYGTNRVFVHLTHCSLVISLALMALHVAVGVFKLTLERVYVIDQSSVVNRLLAIITTLGTSLSFALYVASALLLAGSNGSLPEDKDSMRDGSGSRTMIAYTLCHFVPFFAWMPLYVCRCEVQLMDSYLRAAMWLLAAPLDVLIYSVVLGFMGNYAPSLAILDVVPSFVVGASGVFAWAVAAFM